MGAVEFNPVDFENLADFYWQKRIKQAFALAGFPNPYFRIQDERSGARTRIDGRWLINFSSYDYLGLNGHPAINAAASSAIAQHGTSVSASRLVAGERAFHRELERDLADIYQAEDAIVMVSGHATNVTTIGHLLGPRDLLLYDQRIHNSIMVGGRLSHVRKFAFRHNDLEHLRSLLDERRNLHQRCIIAVEGLYSMDGDTIDLAQLVEIKRRHRCWLFVDEAHALGVLGSTGKGSFEHHGVSPNDVDIWMGTLSKSLASCGGYVAGVYPLVEILRTSAPGFVYSVGLSPPLAAAASAALRIMRAEPERVERVQRRGKLLKALSARAGLDTGESIGAAVVPMIVGDSMRAIAWSHLLFENGINVLPIVHPAVPSNGAMLRFFITAEHSDEDIEQAVALCRQTLDAVLQMQLDYPSIRALVVPELD